MFLPLLVWSADLSIIQMDVLWCNFNSYLSEGLCLGDNILDVPKLSES